MVSPNSRPTPRVRDASEQVAQAIQQAIADRGLQPGDRIGTGAELAAWLGVSRPTLREAIRLLSSVQIVRTARGPGGGVIVESNPTEGMATALSLSIGAMLESKSLAIEDMVEARQLIEPAFVPLAAIRRERLADIEAALRDQQAAPLDPDVVRDVDRRFHRAIAASTGNALLYAFIDWAFEVLQPLLLERAEGVVSLPAILEQHEAIYDAVSSGDPQAAQQAMERHLSYVRGLLSVSDDPQDRSDPAV